MNQAWETSSRSISAPRSSARSQGFERFGCFAPHGLPGDISRPQWRRDSLDGLLDYHVVSSAMSSYPLHVFERKRALGEIVVEYGSTNPVEGSNVQPVGWCLDAWSLGADGIIPWQTVGNGGLVAAR